MHPDARSTGAALWATKELFNIAFYNLDLYVVYLLVRKDNTRAIRFYDKLQHIGLALKKEMAESEDVDSLLKFEINRDTYTLRKNSDG